MAGILRVDAPYHRAVAAFRKQLVEAALRKHRGNRSVAARQLGLQRTYLCRLIREFGIDVPPDHDRLTYMTMPPKARA